MLLAYVNKVGSNWKGENLYEFLFTNEIEGIEGDEWDAVPASGKPLPPNSNSIDKVGLLTTDLEFSLVQESDTFAMWDSVDGIVALAWEDISSYNEYPERRIYFSFGDDIKSIEAILYESDLVLDYNEDKKDIKNED